jgi:demethylmenaquinone methyltransferase/2-methoxy-6-polyprenyl-1,4-benzoquinol methylase
VHLAFRRRAEEPEDIKRLETFMSLGIRYLFAEVPHTYELVNHILTFGLDMLWRKKAAAHAARGSEGIWLDMCTGTGELAVYLGRHHRENTLVIGGDFCLPMLMKAQEKPEGNSISWLQTDAKGLPFQSQALDLITVGFGTRNLNTDRETLLACFREFRRVLKPGGRFVIVETSQPSSPLVRWAFHTYVRLLVTPVGQAISGSRAGYAYLSQTIRAFYDSEELRDLLLESGFGHVSFQSLLFGIGAIHESVN